jgi:hypothetical protein
MADFFNDIDPNRTSPHFAGAAPARVCAIEALLDCARQTQDELFTA